jgi:hypothetical protein
VVMVIGTSFLPPIHEVGVKGTPGRAWRTPIAISRPVPFAVGPIASLRRVPETRPLTEPIGPTCCPTTRVVREVSACVAALCPPTQLVAQENSLHPRRSLQGAAAGVGPGMSRPQRDTGPCSAGQYVWHSLSQSPVLSVPCSARSS